ncbi:succinylglutamate desuccinylase/aspartoacylase domain-containing protein [Phragmitibacter flavus]|nr:succinylglutamate desuccinylase/aspartoacylase family protein [Phragmitibacter flavus]
MKILEPTYEERYVRKQATRARHAPPITIPKLVYTPGRKQQIIKVGIFARLHGDEEAGTHAAFDLIRWAWNDPEEIHDFSLHVYPICNPSGRNLGTRHSINDRDLNREFWTGSQEPEVVYLENELKRERYHIIISLHADEDSDGVYGFVSGDVLSAQVLKPALAAAEKHLPINREPLIDGFLAKDGIVTEGYQGVLSAPPDQHPRPIEIVFETPNRASMEKQVAANVDAVKAILAQYRLLLAHAPNL